MGSPQDLKTYVTAAATGMLSRGFVWLVADALGRLGVMATHGAGTLLASERRQTFSPDSSTEFGGMYVPAEYPAPTPTPASTQPTSRIGPGPRPSAPNRPPARAPSRRPHSRKVRVRGTAFRVPRTGGPTRRIPRTPARETGGADGSTTLDLLGQTLYPLFCVSMHEHAWMAGGYGVWGKGRYLSRFGTCLDRTAVRDAYAMYVRPKH
jgi:Fe-Mn family superoxide dismutase